MALEIDPMISMVQQSVLLCSIAPSELPLALPLPTSESAFTKLIHKKVMTIRDVASVFLSHVSEGSQFTFFVVVGQEFNRKPVVIGFASAQKSQPLERLQQRRCFSGSSHGGNYSWREWLA